MKKIIHAVVAAALCFIMAVPTYAAQNPFAHMEAQSQQAVDAAIQAGTVPPGTTIYDCVYGADTNGVTIVIQYRDQGGNWIDVNTGAITESKPNATAEKLSDEALAEYAEEVLRLVNQEREKAVVSPLQRDKALDEAAMTRALECAAQGSIYVNGQSHTRPDGSRWFTVLGIDKNYNYGENSGQGKNTAEKQMESWMNSDGHRRNILREDYTEIGIACALSDDGKPFVIQIFYRP